MAQFREQLGIRIPHKHARIRRGKGFRRVLSPPVVAVVVLFLVVTLFAFWLLSSDRDIQERLDDVYEDDEEGLDIQSPFNKSMPDRKLRFGRGLGTGGRDSRYWDKDDRRRDDEYDEDSLDISAVGRSEDDESVTKNHHKDKVGQGSGEKFHEGRGLYDEAGRNELKQFEERYKESLNNAEQSAEQDKGAEDANLAGDYDDSIDIDDDMNKPEDLEHEEHHMHEGVDADSTVNKPRDLDHEEYNTHEGRIRKSRLRTEIGVVNNSEADPSESIASLVFLKSSGNAKLEHQEEGGGASIGKTSISNHKPSVKAKTRRRSSCAMKLLNSTKLFEPPDNRKFLRFALQYKEVEDRPDGVDEWKPHFAGHQSLQEREESFYARGQKINCGFVKGPEGTQSTGFDLAEDDVRFMSSCHIAVSSCIFGNSDRLRTPYAKVISRPSRKSVCFVMFVDEKTLQTLTYEGHQPDSMGFIGLWKIVLVKNMPYDDMRRVGKIPKFLAHRLFPSARYSIWLDSKLRLQSDPVVILEYFLWRKGYEYAISNHYDRHCVWDEVLQNKRLNKYNHTIIDEQFAFYQADGLKRFDPSDPDRLLPSYVPEGSFILRAHTPMSNLFSCLWFNEVERFTPRDQLSFAYTYLKLRRMNPEKPFHLHMFKDCERRAITKLFRHRGESKRRVPVQAVE